MQVIAVRVSAQPDHPFRSPHQVAQNKRDRRNEQHDDELGDPGFEEQYLKQNLVWILHDHYGKQNSDQDNNDRFNSHDI